jgi:hypothetical protein
VGCYLLVGFSEKEIDFKEASRKFIFKFSPQKGIQILRTPLASYKKY